jgi:hypothetical protein
MGCRWLFYFDADGRLAGPETAPFPDEARILQTALTALHDAASDSDPQAALLFSDRNRTGLPAPRAGAT